MFGLLFYIFQVWTSFIQQPLLTLGDRSEGLMLNRIEQVTSRIPNSSFVEPGLLFRYGGTCITHKYIFHLEIYTQKCLIFLQLKLNRPSGDTVSSRCVTKNVYCLYAALAVVSSILYILSLSKLSPSIIILLSMSA